MAYLTLKTKEGDRIRGPKDQEVKVNLELREGYFENVRTKCVMRGGAENNIRVGRAAHQAMAEFEKGTHIKEYTVLLKGGEIEGAES